MHARSGGVLEVMGLITGKIEERTIIVMDSFALPVEGTFVFALFYSFPDHFHFQGTETRVNAQVEAYEYMVEYLDLIKRVNYP